jgi:hypothetical protein
MSDYFALLEQDLVDAARRRSNVRPLRRRPPTRSFLLAAVLALLVAGSAMAGTLYILRGDPIPAPAARDAGASQTVEPGSSHVLPMRADDPGGGPAWALRVGRSRTGAICTTVGQEVGGEFGVVGLDDRFRPLADGAVDGCGKEGSTLIGARVFDARRAADARTVVNGVAGPDARSVSVAAIGRDHEAAVGPGGSFLVGFAGYPENLGLDVRVRFADGHVERHPLGLSRSVVPDPAGDRAWVLFPFQHAGFSGRCVTFNSVRRDRERSSSPVACARRSAPFFFAVRRIEPDGDAWRGPARTAVWGELGPDVASAQAVAGKDVRELRPAASTRAVLAVFAPSVHPRSIDVRLLMRDGSRRFERGSANVVRTPKALEDVR